MGKIPLRNEQSFFEQLTGTLGSVFQDHIVPMFHELTEFKAQIREEGSFYIVDAVLPGFTKDDIVIDYEQNYLMIRAIKNNKFAERQMYREVTRSFYAPDIEKLQMNGSFENGLLRLTIPKNESKMNRKGIEE